MLELGRALADTRNQILADRQQEKKKTADLQKTLEGIMSRLEQLEKTNTQVIRKMSEMEIKINSRPRRVSPNQNRGE